MKLNNVNVIDVEVDGLDMKDYPDFVDAYICLLYTSPSPRD